MLTFLTTWMDLGKRYVKLKYNGQIKILYFLTYTWNQKLKKKFNSTRKRDQICYYTGRGC